MASSSTSFPSLGRRLEDFDTSGASYDWTRTGAPMATMTAVSNVRGVVLVMVVGSASPACPWVCLDCLLLRSQSHGGETVVYDDA